jgi:ketosteroid isomerase-like protein
LSAADNKRLVQEIYDRCAERDGALFAASLADEVTWLVTGQNAWSGLFRGKGEVLGKLQAHFRSLLLERPRTVPLRVFADGDHVIVEAKGDNVTRTGVRYDNDYCMVMRLADGKIVEIREYNCSALVERVLGPFPEELAPAA